MTSASTSFPARSSASWATTAPASRRSSSACRASTRPTRARCCSKVGRSGSLARIDARPSRHRDHLPGPRARGQPRCERQHLPRPRDEAAMAARRLDPRREAHARRGAGGAGVAGHPHPTLQGRDREALRRPAAGRGHRPRRVLARTPDDHGRAHQQPGRARAAQGAGPHPHPAGAGGAGHTSSRTRCRTCSR